MHQQLLVTSSPGILPYGESLHYKGCGCPPNWRGVLRLADAVDREVLAAFNDVQTGEIRPARALTVAYMLPHHNVTGGMKCLVEHIRLLRTRGHKVIAVHRSDKARRAMPPWTEVEADVDIVCQLDQRLNDVYDVQTIDVVVVGIFHQVSELLLGMTAPVLYWEQGHEWLFGDPVRFQFQHNYFKQDQLFHMVLHLPVAIAGVSTAVQNILQQEFHRSSLLIPNSIDCDRFCPGPVSENPSLRSVTNRKPKVLLVGNPSLPLKGFDTALSVLDLVNSLVPLHVTWVCQVEPKPTMLPTLSTSKLDINYIVSPSQEQLPLLYRSQDALLFTSRYEAWGMPVMEAMASGVAVVTTNCLGVLSFAQHGKNCMLADTGDVAMLSRHLIHVLNDTKLREDLQRGGRTTALQYKPEAVLDTLENTLYALASRTRELHQIRMLGIEQLQRTSLFASTACLPQAKQQPVERGLIDPNYTAAYQACQSRRPEIIQQPQHWPQRALQDVGHLAAIQTHTRLQALQLQQLLLRQAAPPGTVRGHAVVDLLWGPIGLPFQHALKAGLPFQWSSNAAFQPK